MTDSEVMFRAISLALRGTGNVSPNPRVGCVIVKDDRIIGEGWHEQFGGLHAEANAIRNASESVDGATAVVTLEPCNHTGKQPPCVQLLIDSHIRRVVIGMTDPNPSVSGSGIAALRNAGIDVVTDVLTNECSWVNRFFSKHVTTGLPYVIAKVAQSLDGCISTARGESQWITGEESRRRGHALRAEADAVLVGRKTALTDNPALTVRLVNGRNPRRVVLDSQLSLPADLTMFTDTDATRTIVCCVKSVGMSRKADSLRRAGVLILPVGSSSDSQVNISAVFRELSAKHAISSVLVEGGSQVLSSCVQANCVDELHVFNAPMIIGNGKHSFAGLFTPLLAGARRFQIRAASPCGNDVHIIAVRTSEAL